MPTKSSIRKSADSIGLLIQRTGSPVLELAKMQILYIRTPIPLSGAGVISRYD